MTENIWHNLLLLGVLFAIVMAGSYFSENLPSPVGQAQKIMPMQSAVLPSLDASKESSQLLPSLDVQRNTPLPVLPLPVLPLPTTSKSVELPPATRVVSYWVYPGDSESTTLSVGGMLPGWKPRFGISEAPNGCDNLGEVVCRQYGVPRIAYYKAQCNARNIGSWSDKTGDGYGCGSCKDRETQCLPEIMTRLGEGGKIYTGYTKLTCLNKKLVPTDRLFKDKSCTIK